VIGRVLITLLVVVVALISYPGALLVSLATRLTPAPNAPAGREGALPWLHVAHPADGRPYIADDQGRIVMLHGTPFSKIARQLSLAGLGNPVQTGRVLLTGRSQGTKVPFPRQPGMG